MKILVTGGSGFMGSHIVEALLKTNKHEVYVVDDNSGGNIKNIPNGCFFEELDLRNREKTEEYIYKVKPDIIYALAANAREGASFFQPLDITERNINVLINVLEPAIKNNLKKIIYFSSMSVYGDQIPPFNENFDKKPCDIYGRCKSWCEDIIKDLSEVHKFNYTIVRPHNVMGERQSLRDVFRNVIAIFMNRIMREEPLYIYGDGNQERAFSFIDFSLPSYLKCLDDFTNSKIYNIGGITPITINNVSEIVIKCFSEYKTPRIIHLPDRHGEVKCAWSTFNKSVDELEYCETFGLEEGIKRMSQWAKKQGPQQWTEEKLPLINDKVPSTWTMNRNNVEALNV